MAPTPTPDPVPDAPRRSSRETRAPERLEVSGNGKSYVDTVKAVVAQKPKVVVKAGKRRGERSSNQFKSNPRCTALRYRF